MVNITWTCLLIGFDWVSEWAVQVRDRLNAKEAEKYQTGQEPPKPSSQRFPSKEPDEGKLARLCT